MITIIKGKDSIYRNHCEKVVNFFQLDVSTKLKGVHERDFIDWVYDDELNDRTQLFDEFKHEDEKVFQGQSLMILYAARMSNQFRFLWGNKNLSRDVDGTIEGVEVKMFEWVKPSASSIQSIMEDNSIIVSSHSKKVLDKYFEKAALLTLREEQCLRGLCDGFSIKELSQKYKVSTRTIETHLSNLREKLNLTKNTQLVAWAWQYVQLT